MRCSSFLLFGLSTLLCVAVCSHPVAAEQILFESGMLGETAIAPEQLATQVVPASNVNSFVFSGARFELTQPVVTSGVGGHFATGDGGGGTFFGALIQLDGPDDLPDTRDLSSPDVLGTTLITFPELSADVIGDLEIELDAGWYAIVFGSGLFGANGEGAALRNNTDIPGNDIIARLTGPFGVLPPLAASGHRFVLAGAVVPEPLTIEVFSVFLSGLLMQRPARISCSKR